MMLCTFTIVKHLIFTELVVENKLEHMYRGRHGTVGQCPTAKAIVGLITSRGN